MWWFYLIGILVLFCSSNSLSSIENEFLMEDDIEELIQQWNQIIPIWIDQSYLNITRSKYCETPECLPLTLHTYLDGGWNNEKIITLTSEECTDIDDLSDLICTKSNYLYPCTLFSSWGTRILSCSDLSNEDQIFIIPEDRLYMITTKGTGSRSEIAHINYVSSSGNSMIYIETLLESPKLFRITNFFTQEEANEMIEYGKAYFQSEFSDIQYERDEHYHPITGVIDYHRTCDVLFDYSLDVAISLKKRAFDLLGLYPYDESMVEGFHISRYGIGESSSAHLEWIEPSSDISHDYNSAYEGSNRYVTLYFFLQVPEVGGDLVFPLVETPSPAPSSITDEHICELEQIDEHGNRECLKRKNEKFNPSKPKGSYPLNSPLFRSAWEVELARQCQTRYSIRPKPLEVIIFYSQKANGVPDYLSLHGGCPVMQGEMWLATLHIWNRPKPGWNANQSDEAYSVSASFETKDVSYAKLYWEDKIWEELSPKRPIKVNTYAGHRWNVKVDNEIVMSWVIQPGKRIQRFILRSEDLPVYYY